MAAIIGSKDRKKLAQSIELPTLIIHGDLDPLIKVKNAYVTNKLIAGSDLLIIEGMGHLLDTASYNQFQSQLFKFLKQ